MLGRKRVEQFARFGFALSCIFIVACSNAPRVPKPFTDPIFNAVISNHAAFVELSVPLPIRAFLRSPQNPSAPVSLGAPPPNGLSLTIYIEGDGAAWINRHQPPSDPTPFDPIAAALAMRDPSSWVAYLGRPCQYLHPSALSACKPALWGNERFGPEALSISNQVIDLLRSDVLAKWSLQQAQQSNSRKQTPPLLRIRLIGYSGGGAIAALLAGERDDIDCLITIASPLDIEAWVRLQGLSPLIGSKNPAENNLRLAKLPQTHWYGQQDRIVPSNSLGQYRLYNLNQQSRVNVLPNFDHRRHWVEDWPRLLAQSCAAG